MHGMTLLMAAALASTPVRSIAIARHHNGQPNRSTSGADATGRMERAREKRERKAAKRAKDAR